MAEICRILEHPATPAEPRTEEGVGRVVERISAQRIVQVGGANLDDEFLSNKVLGLSITETARGLSTAEVLIQNDRLQFTDHELLQGNSLDVQIWTGWARTKLVKRGTFLAAVPKYAFRNQAMPTIKLQCYGQEWALQVSEERRVWENLRDSEIAQKIAQQHGLTADVQQTSPPFEHVAQFNMTDIEFLENRALLYGYDVYVEEGVLHFHEPRFEHSRLNLTYRAGETGILNSFNVVVDPWVSGSAWTNTGMDRLTGKEWEFDSSIGQEPENEVSTAIKRASGSGFQSADELSLVNNVRPRRFVVGEGHEQSEGEGRQQLQGVAKASEWIVVGSATVRGIETLKARQVVSMVGMGHLSGDYYVTSVTHSILPHSGYTMKFKVTRPGVGRLEDRSLRSGGGLSQQQRRDVTSRSPSAGEVTVG